MISAMKLDGPGIAQVSHGFVRAGGEERASSSRAGAPLSVPWYLLTISTTELNGPGIAQVSHGHIRAGGEERASVQGASRHGAGQDVQAGRNIFLSIIGGIRLRVGDPSTSSCLVSFSL